MAWKWMDDDNDDQMLRVWLNSMSQISRYHLVLINHHSSPLYLLFHYLCFDSLRYGMEVCVFVTLFVQLILSLFFSFLYG